MDERSSVTGLVNSSQQRHTPRLVRPSAPDTERHSPSESDSQCAPVLAPVKRGLSAWLKRRPFCREMARLIYRLISPLDIPRLGRVAAGYLRFARELRRYRRLPGAERIRALDLYPCVTDKVAATPLDLNYFLQDTWAARKVFDAAPDYHVDIGSTALLVGILAQYTHVCSVDIRPLQVTLEELETRKGSILDLPFADRSLKSISSLCVIEHIGLGRYGDPLDPRGTDRAAAELQRVLAVGGNLYVSVPIDPTGRVYFNAHRSFPHAELLKKFPELQLADVLFIQHGRRFTLLQFPEIDFAAAEVVGLYHFRREE